MLYSVLVTKNGGEGEMSFSDCVTLFVTRNGQKLRNSGKVYLNFSGICCIPLLISPPHQNYTKKTNWKKKKILERNITAAALVFIQNNQTNFCNAHHQFIFSKMTKIKDINLKNLMTIYCWFLVLHDMLLCMSKTYNSPLRIIRCNKNRKTNVTAP